MSKIVRLSIFIVIMSLLGSCGQFLTQRSFVSEMDKETDGIFVAGRDFSYTVGDSGNPYRSRKQVNERTPASSKETSKRQWSRSLSKELKNRENALSREEFISYQKRKRYFNSNSEKIYYLQLHKAEREEYLRSKQAGDNRVSDNRRSLLGLVSDHERGSVSIYLGMNKRAVEKNWGEPSRIDIAGNPRNQNERWTFYQGNRVKKVFFENGVVGGWTTE